MKKNIINIFKIRWKLKSFIFSIIDFFRIQGLLYFVQKNITKRSIQPIHEISHEWKVHEKSIIDNKITGTLFEFGAGKGLAQNIFLSKLMPSQIVVDLYRMIDFDIVNNSIKSINSLTNQSNDYIKSIEELESSFGIKYLAPYDAANTDLESASIDLCVSSHTLEHIPEQSIVDILKELKRTLKPSGYISALIDYSDHYAHTDASISLLNYLYFDEDTWSKYNHDSHFQNRLRHHDYKEIFENLGYEILSEDVFYEEQNIPEDLKLKFKDHPKTTFATSGYFFVKNVKN